MHLSAASLGLKLNLALLAFFILLGAATSALILYGFQRTQDNATERSSLALEQLGKLALQVLVSEMSEAGGIQFEANAETGQRAARQIETADLNAFATVDPSGLARHQAGFVYDPDPNRVSDLVVLNGVDATLPEVRDDIAISTTLNAVFEVLLASFKGELGGEELDPTAVVFISKNGVTRYYPPLGIQNSLSPFVDIAPRMRELGPEGNPGRKTIWTAPYEDSASRRLIVTARSPVYRDGVFRGTLEVDLSIDKLIEKFNSIKPTPNGFAFYVDSAGKPQRGAQQERLVELTAGPDMQAIVEEMKRTTPTFPSYDVKTSKVEIEGADYFVAYSPLLVLGGSFAVAIPVDEVTGEAAAITQGIEEEGRRTLRTTLAAMGGLFVFGLVTATYLNRRVILRPIETMVRGTREVAVGNLNTTISVKGEDELSALAQSFNDMTTEIRQRRASLERQVEERTRELTILLETSTMIASTLELRPLLELLLGQISTVVDYWRVTLFLLEKDNLNFVLARTSDAHTPPGRETPWLTPLNRDTPMLRVLKTDEMHPLWEELSAGRPVIVDDVFSDTEMAQAWQRTNAAPPTEIPKLPCRLVVPLILRDKIIGMMGLAHAEAGFYSSEQAELVMAIASQAAIAIENARLYEQAGKLAAVEERQRLARELHDSVSQALYGIALSATAAQTLLGTEPSPVRQPVDYVMTLAQAAMAEMRALIFELRPESLEVEGLIAAITKQVAATKARHGFEVEASLCAEPEVSLAVKEVFYRVCQEALHNIIKHSQATEVGVSLAAAESRLTLEIRDDGIGFDALQSFPGHMGLISMPERAATVGAKYVIESAVGEGTTVRVSIAYEKADARGE